jgi:hypothetical protein
MYETAVLSCSMYRAIVHLWQHLTPQPPPDSFLG